MLLGCLPCPLGTWLAMYGNGYDARVFSVMLVSSKRTRRVTGSSTTFSSTVPNICVVL